MSESRTEELAKENGEQAQSNSPGVPRKEHGDLFTISIRNIHVEEYRHRLTLINFSFPLQSRKMQDGMEILIRKKTQQCEQLELIEMEMRAENEMLQKRISQMEADHAEQLKQISELSAAVEDVRAISTQTGGRIAVLTDAVRSAKEIMTAFLSVIILLVHSQLVPAFNNHFIRIIFPSSSLSLSLSLSLSSFFIFLFLTDGRSYWCHGASYGFHPDRFSCLSNRFWYLWLQLAEILHRFLLQLVTRNSINKPVIAIFRHSSSFRFEASKQTNKNTNKQTNKANRILRAPFREWTLIHSPHWKR